MSKVKVTFLGTATSIGIPVIGCECPVCTSENEKDKRLRSSVLVEIDNKNFIIDCGPDFRLQMLRENIKTIEAILLTHEHRDHVGGLDDVRGFNYTMKKRVSVYAEQRVINNLESDFSYIFAESKYRGAPEISLNCIKNQEFSISGIKIIPVRVMHHKLEILGFRFGDFAYITDASFISDIEIQKLKNLKVLVLNALRLKPHFSHFSLDEAIEIIQKLKPEKAYLTHISHGLGLHDEINQQLPENIELSYDGLRLMIDD